MSDAFVVILCGLVVWKYGKMRKNVKFALLWYQKMKKWRISAGLRVFLCLKRAFFCKKMPQSGAGVCCGYRLRVKSMNLARCAKYWSISNAIAFCVVLNIGVNALLSCQVFCHSAKLYLTKNIISFGAAWA